MDERMPFGLPGAEVSAYQPSLRDRIAAWFMGDERASPEKERLVSGLFGSIGLGPTGMGLVDLTPAGVPLAADEYKRAETPSDAAFAALGLVPGAKGAAQGAKAIRAYHGSPANITAFDRPAYFSTSKEYADKFARGGNLYEVDIAPRNPYYTNNEMLVEGLRSFPGRADELRKAGHDAVILSASDEGVEPILGLGGYIQPQIYTLDPSIVSKVK